MVARGCVPPSVRMLEMGSMVLQPHVLRSPSFRVIMNCPFEKVKAPPGLVALVGPFCVSDVRSMRLVAEIGLRDLSFAAQAPRARHANHDCHASSPYSGRVPWP